MSLPTQSERFASTNRGRTTAGYSLLELVLAVALVAGTLVPSLALVRDGMELSSTTDEKALLTNYAVGKIEQHLALVAASWTTGTATGDFATDGLAEIRFIVTRSDDPSDGGVSGALMHIQVTTYLDEDGDDALDVSEPRCDFRTKIGKLASYEAKAT